MTAKYLPLVLLSLLPAAGLRAADPVKFEYQVLATTKTSTMEKELNQSAEAGFEFASVMGGESAFGGKQVLVVMVRKPGATAAKKKYRLLATSKTSTMEKELQQAGGEGFDYCGQTVFESTFGGAEVSVILEQDAAAAKRIEYRLLATSKTSTMQKELQQAGAEGYEFLGVMVGKTGFGGREVVSILRKHTN